LGKGRKRKIEKTGEAKEGKGGERKKREEGKGGEKRDRIDLNASPFPTVIYVQS